MQLSVHFLFVFDGISLHVTLHWKFETILFLLAKNLLSLPAFAAIALIFVNMINIPRISLNLDFSLIILKLYLSK